jgi:hypothetical protein
VHRATSPVVLKTGRSLRCMIVELNRLMKFGFETNCMPPIVSRTKSQNMTMFIYGNNTWSIRSRSKSFTCSVFPLTSLKILILGSYGSSRITSLGDGIRPPFSLKEFINLLAIERTTKNEFQRRVLPHILSGRVITP